MAVNGQWSEWGKYSTCSKSCGTGSETKTRTCTNPAPSAEGNPCLGSSSESRNCNTLDCPSKYPSLCILFEFKIEEISLYICLIITILHFHQKLGPCVNNEWFCEETNPECDCELNPHCEEVKKACAKHCGLCDERSALKE